MKLAGVGLQEAVSTDRLGTSRRKEWKCGEIMDQCKFDQGYQIGISFLDEWTEYGAS